MTGETGSIANELGGLPPAFSKWVSSTSENARNGTKNPASRWRYWVICVLIVLSVIVFVYAFSEVGRKPLPPRPVGEAINVKGTVASVSKQPYAVKIVLTVQEANSTFKAGETIEVAFSGVGRVSAWRAYGLKPGDVIHLTIRFVEHSYWEAFDSDWTYE